MATVTKPPILDETGRDILIQLRRIADAKESNLITYGGAVNFVDLPAPTSTNLNFFYLIKDAFTTDSNFVVGPGVSEPAGKYWGVINIGTDASPVYKYDDFGTLIDLSSKQDKVLSTPIVVGGVSQSTVEGALVGLNNAKINTDQLANKTDKVVSATNGHLAGLNSSGNLTDSGVVASNVIQKVATATGLLKNDGTVDTTSYATASNLSNHITNTSNPHSVTKSQVGLGSVVNTGDSATPVSGGTTKFTTGGAYTELNKKYDINDTAETSLVDGDYIPFYDTSATAKRKTLWSNIKSVLKTYFDTIYSTVRSRQTPASGGTTLSLVNTGDMYSWNNKGHTMLPASGSAESTIVSTINGATNTNTNVSSLYSIQKWTNEKRIRKVITGTTPIGSASIGSTGIGKWDDSASPDESTWWYDAAFKIPNNRNDIDLSLKFDPSSGEPVTLGGYILDTTTGKLCIKFGNSIATPANAKIAVDITYTRNEFS
jgi:hypothetical protein